MALPKLVRGICKSLQVMADQEGRRETIQESPIIKAQTIFPTQDGELHSKRKAPPPIGGIATLL